MKTAQRPASRQSRRRRETPPETPEFAAMLRRMIRTYAKRVGNGDEVDFREMLEMRDVLDNAIRDAVQAMRSQGIPWSYIAEGVGISRQAAWKRWGP